jgi:hypothetical protein
MIPWLHRLFSSQQLGAISILTGSLHFGIFWLTYPFGHHCQILLHLLSVIAPSDFINSELIAVAGTHVLLQKGKSLVVV